jgi:uncharacterized damage-inducible protein DinB
MFKEAVMKMTELFLGELEREASGTRRALERVPEGKYDWKPHPKSMAFGYLAELVAAMPSWAVFTIDQEEFDLSTYQKPSLRTPNDLVRGHDEAVAAAKKSLQNTNDEHLMKPWRMLVAGRQVMEPTPRYIVLRDSVFNHLAHHRGQLTVYLRLLDQLVPAIYGPSADEGRF